MKSAGAAAQFPEDWIEVGRLADIPRRGARVVRAPEGDIAVFRTAADEVYALLDRCPHKGGPLSQGMVFDRRVACPLHDWVVHLDSGEAQKPDLGCVRRFAVRVENGRVLLHLEAESAQVAGFAAARG